MQHTQHDTSFFSPEDGAECGDQDAQHSIAARETKGGSDGGTVEGPLDAWNVLSHPPPIVFFFFQRAEEKQTQQHEQIELLKRQIQREKERGDRMEEQLEVRVMLVNRSLRVFYPRKFKNERTSGGESKNKRSLHFSFIDWFFLLWTKKNSRLFRFIQTESGPHNSSMFL